MTSAGRTLVSTIKASWPAARPIWTGWPARVCASLTIMRKRVAPLGARTSLLVSCRSGLASRQSDRPVPLRGCQLKRQRSQQRLNPWAMPPASSAKIIGDRNEFLPTVHGFDEYWGYLYHLDAMEDPFHRNYPPALLNTIGPRNLVHSVATDVDDPTVDPRWGKVVTVSQLGR